ncbi:DUF2066 domain-containing protein [Shewanella schlegeliana]|uniref:DUF2066 domain-containing protein n=1 Tax=Shewanella schlegeliana TaxID=190308 RepID=A0ABS1SZD6_9GAMM|nr:DUF2066 domain-containing protein [Shewanella schlegeliana]MBL4913779.1 DUF2066 domain-containing protein [Shewanella schlegeliana]MCL1108836.1 DUF2066 domain-containing protein [Shewanella schlegeliana]GIU25815.1 hypothetical protein TUM4433_10920 [Shewanella schlegeliana]
MLKFILGIFVIFPFLASLSASVHAADVSSLDEAAVSIESRATTLRSEGIKQAFEAVILKNSGTQAALINPVVQKQLKSASSLMTQYGYFEDAGELYLKVNFDHKRIIRLLRDAGLPVWGKQRPLTLVWLVINENGEREILSDGAISSSRNTFDSQSTSRAVPLLFPLMDLDDSMKVGVNDVRGRFTDNIANASLRYKANYFLIATIEPQGAVYQYQMGLYPRDKDPQALQMTSLITSSGEAATVEDAVTAIVAATSEYYVGQYAIADSGERNTTKIAFVDVTDIKQLVAIERFLAQLSAIKSASIASIQGQTVEFNLALFGDEADLHRLMSLDPQVGAIESNNQQNLDYSSVEAVEAPQKETQIYYWKGQ